MTTQMTDLFTCLRGACLLIAFVTLASQTSQAEMVFDNGAANFLSGPAGDPPMNVEVANSGGGSATTLTVFPVATIGENGDGLSIGVSDSSIFAMVGGTASGDIETRDSSLALIAGGVIDGDAFLSGSSQLILSTASIDDVEASGSSVFTMLPGGEIGDDAFFEGSSRLLMSGGVFPDELQFFDNATALITGGEVGDDIVVVGNAFVQIENVVLDDTLEVLNGGSALINGGVFGSIESITGTSVIMNGGTLDGAEVISNQASTLFLGNALVQSGADITSGLRGTVEVDGLHGDSVNMSITSFSNGTFRNFDLETVAVDLANRSSATLLGGSADSFTLALNQSEALINGGDIGSLEMTLENSSEVRMVRGDFDGITAEILSGSALTVGGGMFAFNGIAIENLNSVFGPGAYIPETGELRFPSGTVTGILADGSPFSLNYSRQPAPIGSQGQIFLQAVPEPSAFVALLVGGTALLVGRRRFR